MQRLFEECRQVSAVGGRQCLPACPLRGTARAGACGKTRLALQTAAVPGGIFPDYELTDHVKTRRHHCAGFSMALAAVQSARNKLRRRMTADDIRRTYPVPISEH